MNLVVQPFAESVDVWNKIARAFGTPFHSAEWLQVLERSQPSKLHLLGIYDGDEVVGVLPLFVRRLWGIRVGASPFNVDNTPYLGIAIQHEKLNASYLALETYARSSGLHFLRIFQWAQPSEFDLSQGVAIVPRHTHVADLSGSEDDLWKRLTAKCRNQIRKAQKSEVTVAREESVESLREYYQILAKVYHEQGMPVPNSERHFLMLWDAFSLKGLKLYIARKDGQMIAGALILRNQTRAYYLSGGSLREANSLCPNYLIQWTAMLDAQSHGASAYDFVGSDIARLAKFKSGFGGNLVQYSLIERASSPLITSARVAYPRIRNFLVGLRGRLRGGANTARSSDD